MEKDNLFKVLQLDSLTNMLDWKERIMIHLYMNSREQITTPKIISVYEWISENRWMPPQMKYGQDFLLYFYDEDSEKWEPVEDFIKTFKHKKSLWTTLRKAS